MYQPKYPKTNFRNPRNTTIPILETQIRGRERERAHLTSTRPGLTRPGFSSGFLSDEFLVWPGFFSDEFFSDGSRAA